MASTLRRGDIAIIGVDTEDTGNPGRDSIAIVFLAPVSAGTIVYITDRAWNGTGFAAGGGGEGTLTINVGADSPAGTVFRFTQAQLTLAGISLSDAGEALYVYQGPNADTPTSFLHAVDIADGPNVGASNSDNFDGNELLNTGLVQGVSAVAIGTDNAKFGTRLWNINKEVAFLQINNRNDWNNNNNSPQPVINLAEPDATAPDAVIYVAGSGGGEGIVQLHLDGTYNNGTVAYAIQHAFQNDANLFHPSDITIDAVNDKIFFVDSDIAGHNRIVQASISQILANPGAPIATTVLYSNTAADPSGSMRTLIIDPTNAKIYFDVGTTFNRINYDTANQTKTQLTDLATLYGATESFITQATINFATNTVYLASSTVDSVFGSDFVSSNRVFVATGLTPTANTLAFTPITFTENDNTVTGEGGSLGATHWPVERGTIRGIDVDESTGNVYIVTGTVILDNDSNGNTTYRGGVWMYNPTTQAITNLYTQNGVSGPVGLLYYIDVDPITGRYYLLDETGTNASVEDSGVWTGLLGTAGTPTFVANVGNINGLGGQGLEIQHAPTLTGTALTPGVTEASLAPNSGETARVALFSNLTASDADTPNTGDELRGALVRISQNFQTGATHQDILTINGAQSGTLAGSNIAYSYDGATGTMTFSGPATVAEYKAALELVRFSTSGDDVTAFGAAGTRTVSASVFDGLLYSDEIHAAVSVTGINDAPVNVAGVAMNFIEDTVGSVGSVVAPLGLPVNAITGISVSDVDADPATQNISVTLSVGVGTISIRTDVIGGIVASQIIGGGNGTGSITIEATQNQINTTLAAMSAAVAGPPAQAAAPNGLIYTPPLNFNGATPLTITTNDLGNNGNDPQNSGTGTTEADTDAKVLNVADVNDAPTVGGDGTVDSPTIFEDTPFTAANAPTVATLFGDQFADARDVQNVSGNPTGSTGDTLAGIAVVTNGSAAGTGQWQWWNGSAWADIGSVSLDAAKTFAAATLLRFNPALNYNGAAPTLTVRLIESSASAVTNNATVDLNPAPPTTGNAAIYSASTVVLSQAITPLNDAPVFANLNGDTSNYTENGAAVRIDNSNNLTITDVDSANFDGGTLTVAYGNSETNDVVRFIGSSIDSSFNVSAGGAVIGVLTTTATGFSVALNANATPARVQEFARSLHFAHDGEDPSNATRSFTFTLVDGDGNDGGLGNDTGTAVANVQVTPVNDNPNLSDILAGVHFGEQQVNAAPQVLDSVVTLNDVDSDFANGSLTLGGGLASDTLGIRNQGNGAGQIGVSGSEIRYGNVLIGTFAGGNGTTALSVTLNGAATTAAVDALIQNLTFQTGAQGPATTAGSPQPVTSRTLSLTVGDGEGGSVLRTITVNVTAENDAPSGTSQTLTINEDQVRTLAASDFGFTDVDGNSFAGVRFGAAPTGGALFFDADGNGGNDPVAITSFPSTTYSAGDIAAGKVTFVPIVNANGAGAASITFTVVDDGGTTGAGQNADASPNTLTLDIAPVNDEPAGADKFDVTIGEDASYTFAAADFGFTDAIDGNAFAGVQIVTLPLSGTIKLNGVAIAGLAFASAADIAGGKLTYTPAPNGNGNDYSSFTFAVRDDGASGGANVNQDQSPNTFSFDVTAVNDAPVVTISPIGAAPKVGGEFLVNTATLDAQYEPTITALPSGGFVVAWQDGSRQGGDASGSGIKAQLFDASGARVGGEFLVNTATFNDQYQPAITALSSGGFVVSWSDGSGDAGGTGIKAQIFNASGARVGGEVLVNTTTLNAQYEPTIAALPSGGFVMSWRDESGQGGDGSGSGIKFQRFDALGGKVGGEVLVNNMATLSDQFAPTIAALPSGWFAVAWTDGSNDGGDVSGYAIKMRIFDPVGSPVGTQFLVNTTTVNNQTEPTITALGTRFVVSWSDQTGDGSDFGIKAQIVEGSGPRSGTKVGGEFLVNTSTLSNQSQPTITALPSGGFVVSWIDRSGQGGDADGFGIKAQIFAASGAKIGGEFLVNTATASFQTEPTITGLPSGGFVVSWTDWSGDPSSFGIKAQIYGPGSYQAIEQTPLNLKGNVTVADVDAGAGVVTATLSVGYGVLNVTAGDSEATVVSGNGTGTVVISGTIAQINRLLKTDTASTITYTPNTDAPPGSTTFNVSVNDNGNTGEGGAQTGSDSEVISIVAVNDAPSGANKTIVTSEDDAYSFTVADFGFTDTADSNSFNAVKITTLPPVGSGQLTYNGVAVAQGDFIAVQQINTGLFKFVPDADESGAPYASFTFQVQDDGGIANGGVDLDQSANTITINVTPDNLAPTVDLDGAAAGIDYATAFTEDEQAMIPIGSDISVGDPEGDTIVEATITLLDSLTEEELRIVNDGSLGSLDITPTVVNDEIVALTLSGPGTAAEYAAALGAIRFSSENQDPTSGATTPTRTIEVVVRDANGASKTAITTITMIGVNDMPFAASVAESGFGNEDTTLSGQLLAGSDVDSTSLTYLLEPGAPAGLTLSASGAWSWTPPANFNGPASFSYKVSDGSLTSDAKQVSLTVSSVNDAPTSSDQARTIDEDTAYVFSLADFPFADVDGNNLSRITLVDFGANGTLFFDADGAGAGAAVPFTSTSFTPAQIANGQVSYRPDLNATGANYATLFFDVVDDGLNGNGGRRSSDSYSFTFSVTGVNDAPVANPAAESGSGNEDTTLSGQLLAGSDVDSASLTYLLEPGAPAGLTLSSSGAWSWTPPANYNGATGFSYRISDGQLTSAPKSVSLTVRSVNDAPTSSDQARTIDEDTAYVFSLADFPYSDVDGHPLDRITLSYFGSNGVLLFDADGAGSGAPVPFDHQSFSPAEIAAGLVSYRPDLNEAGADYSTLAFQVSDGGGNANGGRFGSQIHAFTFNVNGINDAPVANPAAESGSGNEDTTLSGQLLAGSDVDSASLTYLLEPGAPAGLTLSSSGAWSWMPPANYNGATSFSYRVSDGQLTSAPKQVSLTVNSVNDAPSSADQTRTLIENTDYVFSVADFPFSDIDGDSFFRIELSYEGTNGRLLYDVDGTGPQAPQWVSAFTGPISNLSNGRIIFRPDANETGTGYATLTFRVIDDGGIANGGNPVSSPYPFTFNVAPDRRPPVAVDDSNSAVEDGPAATGNVLANDTDPNNDPLTVTAVSYDGAAGTVGQAIKGKYGTLTLNADGSYSYSADQDLLDTIATGTAGLQDVFTYEVSDNVTGSDTGTLTIDVSTANDDVTTNGTSGNNVIYGDRLAPGTEDTIFGLSGDDKLYGLGGADKLYGGSGNDGLYGGEGRDELFGESGNDLLDGGAGNDLLDGNVGIDQLFGRDGLDNLSGGAGNDVLDGGAANDLLSGGSGYDVFVFLSAAHIGTQAGAHDLIADFQLNVDKIDLSALYGSRGSVALTQGITPGAFGLATYKEGGKTWVVGDTDGIGGADFALELTGSLTLKLSDFILNQSQWTSFFAGQSQPAPNYGLLHSEPML